MAAGFPTEASAVALPANEKEQYRFSELLEKYKNGLQKKPDDPVLNYNYGTANYLLENYGEAAKALQKSLGADDLKLQQRAYYNYGNTLYRAGEKLEREKPEYTRQLWQEAIQAYQGALHLNANDAEAQENLEFVQKRLNEMPPPQQDQDKQDDQQEQNEDQQQQDNQQNQQNQNKQDQQQNANDQQNKQDQQQNQNSKDQQNNDKKDSQNQQQKPDANRDPKSQDKNQQPKPEKPDQQKPQEPKVGGMTQEQARAALDSVKDDMIPYHNVMPNFQKNPNPQQNNRKNW